MSNNIESKIRHTERRIYRLNRDASKAYKRSHNIIAVNLMNKLVQEEMKLERLRGVR